MAFEKKVSQAEAVKSFLVMVDGKVDIDASTEKFRSAALSTLGKQETQDVLIVSCLNGLFDQYKGACLNMQFIKSQTVQRMATSVPELGNPSLYSMVATRVEEVVSNLTDQLAKPAKGERPAQEAITDRPFGIKYGPNGGHFRKSDVVAAPVK